MKRFGLVAIVLTVLVGGMAVHHISYDRAAARERVSAVASAARLGRISLGAAWYEGRMMAPDLAAPNPAYPEMESINRGDFVYAH